MKPGNTVFYYKVESTLDKAIKLDIPESRKVLLQPLIDHLESNKVNEFPVDLIFICTENSRRSQFSQIWATIAASQYDIPVYCSSGGTKATAFNPRAVKALESCGFRITSQGAENPQYSIAFSDQEKPVIAYSKLFDEAINGKDKFTAVMVCSHADENCPFIPGAEKRISIHFEDPKEFDNTPHEESAYLNTCLQVASEMLFVFRSVDKLRNNNSANNEA